MAEPYELDCMNQIHDYEPIAVTEHNGEYYFITFQCCHCGIEIDESVVKADYDDMKKHLENVR